MTHDEVNKKALEIAIRDLKNIMRLSKSDNNPHYIIGAINNCAGHSLDMIDSVCEAYNKERA